MVHLPLPSPGKKCPYAYARLTAQLYLKLLLTTQHEVPFTSEPTKTSRDRTGILGMVVI